MKTLCTPASQNLHERYTGFEGQLSWIWSSKDNCGNQQHLCVACRGEPERGRRGMESKAPQSPETPGGVHTRYKMAPSTLVRESKGPKARVMSASPICTDPTLHPNPEVIDSLLYSITDKRTRYSRTACVMPRLALDYVTISWLAKKKLYISLLYWTIWLDLHLEFKSWESLCVFSTFPKF